jgi:flagella basal body P-ring formation protein FlgA
MPWDPADAVIDVENPTQDYIVTDGAVEITWRSNPQYRYVGAGSFRGQIAVDGQIEKTFNCRATVEPYGEVLIARCDIPRGKVISQSDLDLDMRAVSSLRSGTYQRAEDVVGMAARMSIVTGEELTTRNLTPRTVLKRNQVVTVETSAGGLVLQGRAKAMSDACVGDMVVCQNPESNEELQGIVRGDGVVVVQ